MPALTLFAGVDGGGSKTLAVVVDAAGRERGRGTAGSSNWAAVDLERAVAHVRAAVAEATDAAGGELPITAAWIGLAGVARPGDQDAFLPRLDGLAGRVRLTNDADLVLTALPGAAGVAAIAGTGSIILGRDPGGQTARAGGWGHVFGDEGSGYELGRAALQAAARAADGRGPATTLLAAILDHWRLTAPSDLIDRIYHDPGGDKAGIAQLAGLVSRAAAAGDPVARKLVAQAADELTLGIAAVAARLDFPDGRLPLALAGGLLVGEPGLRARVLRRVRRRFPLGPVAVVADPAASAARAAVALAADPPPVREG